MVAARPMDAGAVACSDSRLCWSTIAGLSVIHVGAALGVVWLVARPSMSTVVAAIVAYILSGLAITAGYHRLFAHRTYRAVGPVRWVLLLLGAACFQNSAISWSADHRAHHAHTDTELDPHAISRGFWHAHIGWLARRRDASADVTLQHDLWRQRSVRIQHRWYVVIAIATGLIVPTALASMWHDAVGGLLVIGFLRAAVLLQATFCINSLAHTHGSRDDDPQASARNSTITAVVTFGEGYHSYHHRYPYDFRNGVRWWHFDPSKWLIAGMGAVGLTSRLRRASTPSKTTLTGGETT